MKRITFVFTLIFALGGANLMAQSVAKDKSGETVDVVLNQSTDVSEVSLAESVEVLAVGKATGKRLSGKELEEAKLEAVSNDLKVTYVSPVNSPLNSLEVKENEEVVLVKEVK